MDWPRMESSIDREQHRSRAVEMENSIDGELQCVDDIKAG